jgi:hypothetical protein
MRKTQREPCAFCPATANITREHIWSDWAGELFGINKYIFTRVDGDGKVSTWTHSALNSRTKVVCGDCNGGWMSVLEKKTKSFIKDVVVGGEQTVLQGEAKDTLVAFGFLKAVIADHSHSNGPAFYSFRDRQSFRESLSIPDGVQVWLASLPYQHGLFKSLTLKAKLGVPNRFEMNVFTYGLGHLVIQVAGCRWAKKAHQKHAFPPHLTPNRVWESCSLTLFPNSAESVVWPPRLHLGKEEIQMFVERWVNVTPGIGPVYREGRKSATR